MNSLIKSKDIYMYLKFLLSYFFLDFMHACNYLSTRDKTVTTTMDNYIVMQPMPNLRYNYLFLILYIKLNDSFLCAIILCNHIWVVVS